MKIEIVPTHIPAYSRKQKLKTETDTAVDLDPEKSRSGSQDKDQRNGTRPQLKQEDEMPMPALHSDVGKDPTRIHVVA